MEKNNKDWGSTFEMNPGQTYLTDEEYAERIALLQKYLLHQHFNRQHLFSRGCWRFFLI
ncbi:MULTISPECIES: hypothetical protein [unclassified Paenibacillus]|uniref:hypothetical protein n=1 Tax=unclassified Paenibacillus TaxID=185978 RepID=UPI002406E921|nr:MULTISPECIES: hypothetical protein [unclassified Paenibacillus]MDF9844380.1 hypothetical protein [Paenibacillus sp. PastF-2]MDF9850984.1 hypothetical protein [Paenibacillus sp. PastM-2]MDF9857555.1 hypothetical protein [Paenibacillus sp. PastF-1]MDH6482804.1 hypothetical protein [Paenibacillus sp. PastH-2]MDH6510229.1 hypothetical protein [Paenibacillus sp. PastM-3]